MAATLDPEARRRVLHRLRRAQGQLAAVIRLVEEGEPCRDVVTQLSATSKALNRAGVVMISSAMKECLTGADTAQNPDALEVTDFEKMFLMLA